MEKMDFRLCFHGFLVSINQWFSLSPIRGHQRFTTRVPIIPLLFNIVVEALSSLLYSAVSSNLFQGIKVGSEAVTVSHLQFADDTIIFCEPDLGQIRNVKRILRCFQVMSGLSINFLKSYIFGINLEQHTLREWADMICCNVNVLPSTYLGLCLLGLE